MLMNFCNLRFRRRAKLRKIAYRYALSLSLGTSKLIWFWTNINRAASHKYWVSCLQYVFLFKHIPLSLQLQVIFNLRHRFNLFIKVHSQQFRRLLSWSIQCFEVFLFKNVISLCLCWNTNSATIHVLDSRFLNKKTASSTCPTRRILIWLKVLSRKRVV